MESQSNDKNALLDQLTKIIVSKSNNDHPTYPKFIRENLEKRPIEDLNRLLKEWNERKRS